MFVTGTQVGGGVNTYQGEMQDCSMQDCSFPVENHLRYVLSEKSANNLCKLYSLESLDLLELVKTIVFIEY